MKYLPTNSIKSFMAVPQVKAHNLSKLMTPDVAKGVEDLWKEVPEDKTGWASPDADAIEFYCLNHLVSIVKVQFDENEALPEWAQAVMKKYVECLARQAKVMTAYMLLIVTRESRHLGSTSPKWYQKLNPAFKTFHSGIKGKGSETAAKAFAKNAPNMPLGEYCDSIVKVFGGSFSGGYGGEPWANIAECLARMVNGEISLELMVDAAYSLAHNNGPMFNKGMLYQNYTHQFIKILDVQRGGQMPQAVANNELASEHSPMWLKVMVQTVLDAVPGCLEHPTYVDWNQVEQLGSKKKYPNEKKKMPKVPVKPLKKGDFIEVGELDVMPNVSVKILKRVA